MKALGRSQAFAALCVTAFLTASLSLDASLAAQAVPSSRVPQPRSTTNPNGGLRGNSERGLAGRGSSRGISGRTTARPPAPIVAVEPAGSGVLKPTTGSVPSPLVPAPAPRAKPAPARPRAPLDKPRPRMVRLKQGGVLRGRAHLVDGVWTIRTRDGTQTIAADDVQRADLESDILSMVRKRRRGMDRTDPIARLNEARWMLDLGLAREALGELDELLQRDDAEAGALALLERDELLPLTPRAPATLDGLDAMQQLLDTGTRSSPAVQELVIQELVEHGARHRNELERRLRDQRLAHNPAQRDFAERALRRLFGAR